MPNLDASDYAGYHQFTNIGREHGSFEVFWEVDEGKEGWWWWACFPGCLPDGEPTGPFDTSKEAYEDARSF